MIRIALQAMSSRQRAASAVLVGLLLVGALLETAIFLMIVPLAQVVASGESKLSQQIGPVSVDVSTTRLVILTAALVALLTTMRFAANYLQARLSTAVEKRERTKLFDEYIAASWDVQAQEPHGRIQSIAGFASAKGDLIGMIANTSRYALNIAVMLAAAFLVAPIGALAISALGAALFLAFRPLVAASRRLSGQVVAKSTEHNEDLGEMIGLGADIRVFNASHAFRHRLMESNRLALIAKRRATVLSGSIVPAYQAIGLTLAVVILGYAASRDVDVPVLGAVVILLIRSMSYGQGLQGMAQKFAEYRPSIEMLEGWHENYASRRVDHGDTPLDRIESLELVNCTYFYDGDAPAVESVDLVLRSGEQLGLVGPSGSGKTTISQLMLGLRLPTQGEVLVNGRPHSDYDESDLRRNATLVPQRANAFRGSIRENIAFFRPGVTEEDIERAAHLAGLAATIADLPQGLDTEIGPARRELSGGQLQRLGIARALAGRPSLIVLDEPTSALDVDSEELVTDTLRALPADVIVVIVAHRVSTLRDCDRIAVLEGGRMVAVGPPSSVASSSEFFRRALASGNLDEHT